MRQWVLSLPWKFHYLLAHNPKLTALVLKTFLQTVATWLRKKAGAHGKKHLDAVTFIQRFGSALNLPVHFHALIADGVFYRRNGKQSFTTSERLARET